MSYTVQTEKKQHDCWTIRLTPATEDRPAAFPPPSPLMTIPPRVQVAPPSLQVFLVRNGGLDPEYNRGQWRHELALMRDSGRQGVMPGLLNRKQTKTFEEIAQLCHGAGYISEPDVDEMLFGLAKDIEATLTGERRHRVYGHDGIEFANSLAYERWLENLPQEEAA